MHSVLESVLPELNCHLTAIYLIICVLYVLYILTQKKESSKSSVKKKVTKVAEAKKIMKRNFKVNKKITFTDEGEVRFLNASCLSCSRSSDSVRLLQCS